MDDNEGLLSQIRAKDDEIASLRDLLQVLLVIAEEHAPKDVENLAPLLARVRTDRPLPSGSRRPARTRQRADTRGSAASRPTA